MIEINVLWQLVKMTPQFHANKTDLTLWQKKLKEKGSSLPEHRWGELLYQRFNEDTSVHVQRLVDVSGMNYSLLVESLQAEYDHVKLTAEAVKTKLMNCSQLDGESINDFGAAIKSLT